MSRHYARMGASHYPGSEQGIGKSRFSGFTLLELMIGVAILAVLLVVGIPSFQTFFQSSRLNGAREGLTSALSLARMEAVSRGGDVIVCRSLADFSGCSNGNDWDSGWLVGVVSGGAVNPVLQTWGPPPSGVSVTVVGATTSVTFNSDGSTDGVNAYAFTVQDANDQWTVSVSTVGSISVRR